jgi:hypothetical protein
VQKPVLWPVVSCRAVAVCIILLSHSDFAVSTMVQSSPFCVATKLNMCLQEVSRCFENRGQAWIDDLYPRTTQPCNLSSQRPSSAKVHGGPPPPNTATSAYPGCAYGVTTCAFTSAYSQSRGKTSNRGAHWLIFLLAHAANWILCAFAAGFCLDDGLMRYG